VRGSRGAALAICGLLVAFVAGGCELLMGRNGFAPGFVDDFPSPSPIASFATGSATITIDGGAPITLADLDKDSGIETYFGSNVHWSNADGWHLRINGAGSDLGESVPPPEIAFLTIDRITDGQHWTTYDPSRCVVDIAVADETGMRGTATCKGLEWYDALGAITAEPKSLGQPKFDAEIAFEAAP
jgi:hypothetical protein